MARTVLDNGVILPAEYSDDWYEDMTSNLTKLDDVIGSDSEKLNADGVYFLRMSSAALTDSGTGNFSDLNSSYKIKTGDLVLDSGRKLYQVVSVDSTNERFTVGNSLFKITAESDLAPVAESGDYDDLDNKPDLKPVATSGDYDDLTNKPGYGILRMTSETLSDSGSGAISNLNSDSKLAAGDYVLDAALKVFPIAAVSAPNYTVGTSLFQITNASALAAVATSGRYDDLNNLPTYGITRFVNAAISDNSNVAFANISSVDKIKARDFLLDNAGKMYLIASVDSVNETAAVTTPLTQLAVDANVVHNSGNEIVNGDKTFSNSVTVKNSNVSGASRSFVSVSRTVEIGDTNTGDNTRFIFLDKNKSEIAFFRLRKLTNSNNDLGFCVNNIDTNNNNISAEINLVLDRNNDSRIVPSVSNFISLGRQFSRWKNVWTSQINGLTPSILSLPNYAQRMDILGYITDLTGGNNIYTPIANGYIFLRTDSGLMLEILDASSGVGSSSIVQSNDKLRIFLPVIAQRNVYIKANCTSLVSAVFIPCYGNI